MRRRLERGTSAMRESVLLFAICVMYITDNA